GVRFYGEPTEFEAETLSLHNRIGSWALRLDVPQDTLQGVRAPQGVGTLQGVADAHVAPYRLKAWGKQAASVLKNGINTRRHVLVFAMNGDY
ncbi:hypothetical protein HAP94_21970, partial [Acidithiobacillus ferrivorans]|nr:hypothetical protein [Acidithiobacillus ferrivorans]